MKRSSKITLLQLCERLGVDPQQFTVEPPSPPRPPALELAQVVDEPVQRRDKSLFEGLVGDLRHLLMDVRDWPDKYPPDTEDFLLGLMAGRRPPSAEETRRLDELTYLFATSPDKPKAEPESLKRREPPQEEEALDEAREENFPAFWWL